MFALPDKYRYPLVLALVAAGILAVGLALKPTPKPTTRKAADVTATRAELESLQRLVQRNSLRNIGAQFSTVADDVSGYLLPLSGSVRNAMVWTGGGELVAKNMGDLPRAISMIVNGQVREVPPDEWVPGVPFALAHPVFTNAITPNVGSIPAVGAWVVAVSVRHGRPPVFRPGIYNGTSAADCGPFIAQKVVTTIPLGPELIGGAIFDLQTNLVGIIAECEDSLAVIAPDELRSALQNSVGLPLLARYGMLAQVTNAAWQQALGGAAGMVVTDVWRNWPADVAGIEPGDTIVSVDGQAVAGLPQLRQLLNTQANSHQVEVQRGRRNVRLNLPPIEAINGPGPRSAVDIAAPEQGIVLERVLPGSSAARAGLHAGDRILRVAGARATAANVLAQLGPIQVGAPLLVVALRGSHAMGVLLQ